MVIETLGVVLAQGDGGVDPVLVGIVVVLLAFVFFVYLFLRRIVLGFREGLNQGRNDR